ncbi:MAG: hypothetical protein Q9181_007685, partial [Wetmoreana brouardii]
MARGTQKLASAAKKFKFPTIYRVHVPKPPKKVAKGAKSFQYMKSRKDPIRLWKLESTVVRKCTSQTIVRKYASKSPVPAETSSRLDQSPLRQNQGTRDDSDTLNYF